MYSGLRCGFQHVCFATVLSRLSWQRIQKQTWILHVILIWNTTWTQTFPKTPFCLNECLQLSPLARGLETSDLRVGKPRLCDCCPWSCHEPAEPCGRVCVWLSCRAQNRLWWWVVLLLCRPLKKYCPRHRPVPAHLINSIFMHIHYVWTRVMSHWSHMQNILVAHKTTIHSSADNSSTHKHQAYSHTPQCTQTQPVTPTVNNSLSHTLCHLMHKEESRLQQMDLSLLYSCKLSGKRIVLRFLYTVCDIYTMTSYSPALTFMLSVLCLTGWEEAQWPLWRKRLQRRL